MPVQMAAELTRSGATLFNVYGPTETTVWSTAGKVDPANGVISLGAPLPGEWVYVMDAAGRAVAPGAAGELWIGGAGVAEGYHDRADLSAERFVDDPGVPGARCYRTGDVVRQDSAGELRFLGRSDGQVKLRGHRIELGEVEERLSAVEGVAEVVAVVHGDGAAARLIAYFSPVAACGDLVDRMKEVARAELPSYMGPSQYVEVSQFPLTTSGKIHRRALQPPQQLAGEEVRAPRNAVEGKLVEVWASLLGAEAVSIQDDFFDLGGTSLLAVMMLEKVRGATGLGVSLAEFMKAPRLSELAEALRAPEEVDDVSLAVLKGGLGPTFWMLHGVMIYKELADALPDEVGLTGMYVAAEMESILGRALRAPSVSELVAPYVDGILAEQPNGPYRLGGFSFGGVIAYEAARVLQAKGHEVELVVLLDANLPFARKLDVVDWIRFQMFRLVSPGPRGAIRTIWRALARKFSSGREAAVSIEALAVARRRFYREGIKDYRPGTYDGATLLIRSIGHKEHPGRQVPHDLGWGGFASRLEMEQVQSLHVDIVKPPAVHAVAAAIAQRFKGSVRDPA